MEIQNQNVLSCFDWNSYRNSRIDLCNANSHNYVGLLQDKTEVCTLVAFKILEDSADPLLCDWIV